MGRLKEYTIKKGNHFAYPIVKFPLFRCGDDRFSWTFRLDESCLYKPFDWENDYNKVCGVSFGHHWDNSIRLGWRKNPRYKRIIDFAVYSYYGGTRQISESFAQQTVGQTNNFCVNRLGSDFWQVWWNGRLVADVPCKYKYFGYFLWPYFGGNHAAPHKMKIHLKVNR